MLAMPTMDSVTGIFSDPRYIGAYFAIASFATGIGGALGSFASGRIVQEYAITDSLIPWLIYAGFTLILLIIFKTLIKKETITKSSSKD